MFDVVGFEGGDVRLSDVLESAGAEDIAGLDGRGEGAGVE